MSDEAAKPCDVGQWFTVTAMGHEPFKPEDIDALEWDAAKALAAKRFPHQTEMMSKDNPPLHPVLVFAEVKQPWTSFYSRTEAVVVFAFSDSKDAVEFRLKA